MRPLVTDNDGWFVAGKFDQYRRDLEFGGIFQASRALGRLLLAEPEEELVGLRERMLTALDRMRVWPPRRARVRRCSACLRRSAIRSPLSSAPSTLLCQRCARWPRRNVRWLVFVDDLQWAGPTSIGVIDMVFREQVEGLLLVTAYRDNAIRRIR